MKDKIYFSRICNPEEFPDVEIYWFPFAERIARMKYGIKVVKLYVWIRLKLDKKI